jgi:hypothetical protein
VTRHGTTSGTVDEVQLIAAAIDQLEADVRARSGRPEHTARVAEIWLMVASLDPELARRTERYGTQASAAHDATTDSTADAGGIP